MLHNICTGIYYHYVVRIVMLGKLAGVISKKLVDLCTHYLPVFLKWNMSYLSTMLYDFVKK